VIAADCARMTAGKISDPCGVHFPGLAQARPRDAASAFERALRVARVPPMDYRHKPRSGCVRFRRRLAGQQPTKGDILTLR
jgi:hypothetical protein